MDMTKEEIGFEFVPTGFDEEINFLRRGNLVVLAGRPMMGKTALATCIVSNIPEEEAVLYISLGNPTEEIVKNAIEYHCRHKYSFDKCPSPEDFQNKLNAVKKLKSKDITFFGREIFFDEIRNSVDSFLKKKTVSMIIVDDLQHILLRDAELSAYENIKNRNAILAYFKKIARDNNLVSLVLCNCSRKSDERLGHLPKITDFDDCEPEIYADTMAFIVRRSFYDPIDRPGMAELYFKKGDLEGNYNLLWMPKEHFGMFNSKENYTTNTCNGFLKDEEIPAFKPFVGNQG